MNVYLYPSNVETPLKNAYIGKYTGYIPWANTIAYYPLTSSSTVNDESGNNMNLGNTGMSFGTYNWVDCASTTSNQYLYNNWPYWLSWNFTFSFYAYYAKKDSYWRQPFWFGWDDIWIYLNPSGDYLCFLNTTWPAIPINSRCHIALTYDWTSVKLYLNSSLWATENKSSYTYDDWPLRIGRIPGSWTTDNNNWNWWLSEFIIENRAWTASEIADYYDSTKGNYLIS